MKFFLAFMLPPLVSILTLANPSSAEDEWKQPYPHSRGAELLPYCQQTDQVVSQLRCDYYIQGIADLVTNPVQGVPLACIPRGLNRTELMQLAVEYLVSLEPQILEKNSAASLLLTEFQKTFPCPKKEDEPINPQLAAALKAAVEKAEKEKVENAEKE